MNTTLLNNLWVREKRKKKKERYLELNETKAQHIYKIHGKNLK